MTKDIERPVSKLIKVVRTTAFAVAGLWSLYVPIRSSIELQHAIASHAEKIPFDKGAYYLFGGGLYVTGTLLLLLYGYLVKQVKPNKVLASIITVWFFFSIISIPILPQILSVGVGNYLENNEYTYCEKLSHQWTFVRTMVYTKKGGCK